MEFRKAITHTDTYVLVHIYKFLNEHESHYCHANIAELRKVDH